VPPGLRTFGRYDELLDTSPWGGAESEDIASEGGGQRYSGAGARVTREQRTWVRRVAD